MTTRNLNHHDTWQLYLFMLIRGRHDLAGDIGSRAQLNVLSWKPYGGIPDLETTTLVSLDTQWEGDRELLELATTYGIGVNE